MSLRRVVRKKWVSQRFFVGRRLSTRPWHEPKILFPSVERFREFELRELKEFVGVAKTLDSKVDESSSIAPLLRRALDEFSQELVKDETDEELRIANGVGQYCKVLFENNEEKYARDTACIAYALSTARALLPRQASRIDDLTSEYLRSTKKNLLLQLIEYISTGDKTTIPKHSALTSQKIHSKLRNALEAWAFGDWRQRLEAQFHLYDHDDDGLLERDQLKEAIEALATPIGDALARAHTDFVQPTLTDSKPRLKRHQSKDATDRLRTGYLRYKLDVPAKARSIPAWAEQSRVIDNSASTPMLSTAWLLGTGGPRHFIYLDLESTNAAVSAFFPELDTLSKNTADDLLQYRTDYWRVVEENRTTQYLTLAFCFGCAVLDGFIMFA